MPSIKRLSSVCQSIAHHAASGLSFVHPHVLAACRNAGVAEMTVNLLDSEPCPESFRDIEPLKLSLRALRTKFEHILGAEGFASSDLSEALLVFTPDPRHPSDYCSICHASLTAVSCRHFEYVVNSDGETLARQPELSEPMSPPDIEAEITFLTPAEGGGHTPARSGYRPQFYYRWA